MTTMTGSMGTVGQDAAGLAGLAVRAGRALERWGTRAAQPATRAEIEHRRAAQLERQRAQAARDLALHGMYRVLR